MITWLGVGADPLNLTSLCHIGLYSPGAGGGREVISQAPGVSELERTLKIAWSRLSIIQMWKLRLREGSDLSEIAQLVRMMRLCQALGQRRFIYGLGSPLCQTEPEALGKVWEVLERERGGDVFHFIGVHGRGEASTHGGSAICNDTLGIGFTGKLSADPSGPSDGPSALCEPGEPAGKRKLPMMKRTCINTLLICALFLPQIMCCCF